MAVKTVREIYVDCDKCGNSEATMIGTQKEYMTSLRERGWTFGKEVLCPICKGQKEWRREKSER